MLLAGREREHPAALAIDIDGLAGETTRHLADEFVTGREQTHIGAAEAERDAERLAFRRHDVRAHFAGRRDEAERHDLRHRHDQQRAGVVARLGERRQIMDVAEEARVLHHDAGRLGIDQVAEIFRALGIGRRGDNLEAGELAMGLDHFTVMRMEPARQHGAAAARDAVRHHHRFAGGGRPVVHRGVGDIHAGQQRHLGLELEQILQRALRHLRLVRRVGSEEFAALDQVVDRGWDVVTIGAGAEEAGARPGAEILRRQSRHVALHFQLALERRQIDRRLQPRRIRYVAVERIDRRHADLRQHGAAVVVGQGQITHQCNPSTYFL